MPIFIDVFHGFYRTAIVPTFIDIVPLLINIVPTNNLFLIKYCDGDGDGDGDVVDSDGYLTTLILNLAFFIGHRNLLVKNTA